MFNRTRIPFWRRKNSRTPGICNGPNKCVNSWALYDVEGTEVDAIRRFYEAFGNKSRCRGYDRVAFSLRCDFDVDCLPISGSVGAPQRAVDIHRGGSYSDCPAV